MGLNHAALDSVEFADPHQGFRQDVLCGLSGASKTLAARCFYDHRGSELFEAITRAPEYYLTRTELAILEKYRSAIAASVGDNCVLIELGSGSSRKIRCLLETLKPKTYIPVDISGEYLRQSICALQSSYPWLDIQAICGDFDDIVELPPEFRRHRMLVYYSGSSIGNLKPDDAEKFLRRWCRMIGPKGMMLIGVDTKKDRLVLDRAYNDSQGLTAAFNKNLLHRINRELDGNFKTSLFEHRAEYDDREGCVKMYLVSTSHHSVQVDGRRFTFRAGERIHTENSYKYSIQEFGNLVRLAGFVCRDVWCDEKNLFSVHCLGSPVPGA